LRTDIASITLLTGAKYPFESADRASKAQGSGSTGIAKGVRILHDPRA